MCAARGQSGHHEVRPASAADGKSLVRAADDLGVDGWDKKGGTFGLGYSGIRPREWGLLCLDTTTPRHWPAWLHAEWMFARGVGLQTRFSFSRARSGEYQRRMLAGVIRREGRKGERKKGRRERREYRCVTMKNLQNEEEKYKKKKKVRRKGKQKEKNRKKSYFSLQF